MADCICDMDSSVAVDRVELRQSWRVRQAAGSDPVHIWNASYFADIRGGMGFVDGGRPLDR